MSSSLKYEKIEGTGEILSPFTILVDTREQRPYTFDAIYGDAKDKGRRIQVKTERGTLHRGDYSILGRNMLVGIERKSKEDLYASVARRENFEGRLHQMTEHKKFGEEYGAYYAVVVEAELLDCLLCPPAHSKLVPKSLNRTIMAWRQRYLVDWYFLPSREFAEEYTYRILERFYSDSLKRNA